MNQPNSENQNAAEGQNPAEEQVSNESESCVKIEQAYAGMMDRFPSELVRHYPRIAQKINSLWGTAELNLYMESLFLSDRGHRQGFGESIIREITELRQTHNRLFSEHQNGSMDPVQRSLAKLHEEAHNAKQLKAKPAPFNPSDSVISHEDIGDFNISGLGLGDGRINAASMGGDGFSDFPQREKSLWYEITEDEELHLYAASRMRNSAPGRDPRRLGEILVDHTVTPKEAVEAAMSEALASHEPVGQIMVRKELLSEEDLIRALCLQEGIPSVNLNSITISAEAIKKISMDVAQARQVVPVALFGKLLFLAVENPTIFVDKPYFSFMTGCNIELLHASRESIANFLENFENNHSSRDKKAEFRELAQKTFTRMDIASINSIRSPELDARIHDDDDTVVSLVNKMIKDAADAGVSDIHIEAWHGVSQAQIRMRRDGRMEHYSEYPTQFHDAVISRIKIMANLDIAERRKSQDGKIEWRRSNNGQLELRVSTIPTLKGMETATIRLLPQGEPIPLVRIGLTSSNLKWVEESFKRPYGLLLVCGPTGAGKTTTLHSVLKELNDGSRKIWTAEDPVEITQQGICQVQVHSKIGWTFASALRSFLRADPDVIMIGEMRDSETAHIAIEASMTGHLVLSTLHTNSAAETMARLLDLGSDPFSLADALIAVLAQRLAARICKCSQVRKLAETELDNLAGEWFWSAEGRMPAYADRQIIVAEWKKTLGRNDHLFVRVPVGCPDCQGRGFKGRIGLHELLRITPEAKRLIIEAKPASEFLMLGTRQGMRTLKQDGMEKVFQGLTTFEQVRAACV